MRVRIGSASSSFSYSVVTPAVSVGECVANRAIEVSNESWAMRRNGDRESWSASRAEAACGDRDKGTRPWMMSRYLESVCGRRPTPLAGVRLALLAFVAPPLRGCSDALPNVAEEDQELELARASHEQRRVSVPLQMQTQNGHERHHIQPRRCLPRRPGGPASAFGARSERRAVNTGVAPPPPRPLPSSVLAHGSPLATYHARMWQRGRGHGRQSDRGDRAGGIRRVPCGTRRRSEPGRPRGGCRRAWRGRLVPALVQRRRHVHQQQEQRSHERHVAPCARGLAARPPHKAAAPGRTMSAPAGAERRMAARALAAALGPDLELGRDAIQDRVGGAPVRQHVV